MSNVFQDNTFRDALIEHLFARRAEIAQGVEGTWHSYIVKDSGLVEVKCDKSDRN